MLERPPSDERRRLWRERKRRERAREALGEARYVITLPENDLAEAMQRSGQMTEAETLRHEKVEQQIAEMMREFIERWKAAAALDVSP